MLSLLSVDWDFFFPEKSNDPKLMYLYDWGHRDAGSIFLEYLWYSRAAAFASNGMELPDTTGEEITFWDRFKFSPGCKMYFADSHVCAYDEVVREGVASVVNFDAHHDGGYSTTIGKIVKSQNLDCGSWMVGYYLNGAFVQTVYPKWKAWAMKGEAKPAIPKMIRRVDGAKNMPKSFQTFDRIFVCRSGGWSPSWLDHKFEAFLKACPVQDKIDIGLTPRTWDPEQFQHHIEQMKQVREMGIQLQVANS